MKICPLGADLLFADT